MERVLPLSMPGRESRSSAGSRERHEGGSVHSGVFLLNDPFLLGKNVCRVKAFERLRFCRKTGGTAEDFPFVPYVG